MLTSFIVGKREHKKNPRHSHKTKVSKRLVAQEVFLLITKQFLLSFLIRESNANILNKNIITTINRTITMGEG